MACHSFTASGQIPFGRGSSTMILLASYRQMAVSGGYLLVGSFYNNIVLRYDENTGAFVDQFDPHNLGDLKNPVGGVFGPDGNLYVSSGIFLNNNHKVLQYNGTTGRSRPCSPARTSPALVACSLGRTATSMLPMVTTIRPVIQIGRAHV